MRLGKYLLIQDSAFLCHGARLLTKHGVKRAAIIVLHLHYVPVCPQCQYPLFTSCPTVYLKVAVVMYFSSVAMEDKYKTTDNLQCRDSVAISSQILVTWYNVTDIHMCDSFSMGLHFCIQYTKV